MNKLMFDTFSMKMIAYRILAIASVGSIIVLTACTEKDDLEPNNPNEIAAEVIELGIDSFGDDVIEGWQTKSLSTIGFIIPVNENYSNSTTTFITQSDTLIKDRYISYKLPKFVKYASENPTPLQSKVLYLKTAFCPDYCPSGDRDYPNIAFGNTISLKDGGFIMIAYVWPGINLNLRIYYVIKFDESMNIVWKYKMPEVNPAYNIPVAENINGSIMVAYSSSVATDKQRILTLDKDGNKLLHFPIKTEALENENDGYAEGIIHSIIALKNGDFALVGDWTLRRRITCSDGVSSCGDSRTFSLLMRTDESGNIIWTKKSGTSFDHDFYTYMNSVVENSDGSIWTFGYGGNDASLPTVMKFSGDGSPLWIKSYDCSCQTNVDELAHPIIKTDGSVGAVIRQAVSLGTPLRTISFLNLDENGQPVSYAQAYGKTRTISIFENAWYMSLEFDNGQIRKLSF